MPEHHVVLSYGDVFRQSGYRTKVLGELTEYERHGRLKPVLIAFDRDADQLTKQNLDGVEIRAHGRRDILACYRACYRDFRELARLGPIRTVHAHNLYSGALALSVRRRYRFKLVVELHGRIPEEYVILGKGGTLSYWLLKRLERWVIRGADHVIPISNKLRDYLMDEYGLPASKLTVIPDCADPRAFRWDPALREATRTRLGLAGKFVCVHLGSVFTWYDPDLILKVFGKVRERVPSAHLLVVTEEEARTRDYLAQRVSPESFTVVSAPHAEVPAFLTASDVGFLLLLSTENIRVSSPAKFSEYLNSGLPVLITPEVGDFSGLVRTAGVGSIVADNGEFDVTFVDRVLKEREAFALRSMEAGRPLTWDGCRAAWTTAMASL
jgi:glycosyltransferase involved in cell wall biosynthesis